MADNGSIMSGDEGGDASEMVVSASAHQFRKTRNTIRFWALVFGLVFLGRALVELFAFNSVFVMVPSLLLALLVPFLVFLFLKKQQTQRLYYVAIMCGILGILALGYGIAVLIGRFRHRSFLYVLIDACLEGAEAIPCFGLFGMIYVYRKALRKAGYASSETSSVDDPLDTIPFFTKPNETSDRKQRRHHEAGEHGEVGDMSEHTALMGNDKKEEEREPPIQEP